MSLRAVVECSDGDCRHATPDDDTGVEPCSGTVSVVEHRETPAAQCGQCGRIVARATDPPSITVVLPTYQEPFAPQHINNILKETTGLDVEVIVVDDSPQHTTATRITDAVTDPSVTVIKRHNESGLSSAILRGVRAATRDIVVVQDADGQHPASAVLRLAAAVEGDGGADMAVGSRYIADGGIVGDWPAHRKLTSVMAIGAASIAVPSARRTFDPMSGCFAVAPGVIEDCDDWEPRGFKAVLEIMERCDPCDVVDVGIQFRPRQDGESTFSTGEAWKFAEHCTMLRAQRTPVVKRYVDRWTGLDAARAAVIGVLGAAASWVFAFTVTSGAHLDFVVVAVTAAAVAAVATAAWIDTEEHRRAVTDGGDTDNTDSGGETDGD